MISIVTTFKPFKGIFKTIQLNALRSWLRFCPSCEIIILGDDEGSKQVADEYGLLHVTNIPRNSFGTPLLDGLIKIGSDNARFDTICLMNSDIILLKVDLRSLERVTRLKKYLLTSKRRDVIINGLINYEDAKQLEYLWNCVKMVQPKGNDLFMFRRDTIEDYVPPLPIGRGDHARLLIYLALKMKMPVIDATRTIYTLHQHHDYSHITYLNKVIRRGIELSFTPEGRELERLCPYSAYFGGGRLQLSLKRFWRPLIQVRYVIDR